jgi:hypothetical protein
MIIWQAALALFHHICARELQTLKLDKPETLKRLGEIMHHAW